MVTAIRMMCLADSARICPGGHGQIPPAVPVTVWQPPWGTPLIQTGPYDTGLKVSWFSAPATYDHEFTSAGRINTAIPAIARSMTMPNTQLPR